MRPQWAFRILIVAMLLVGFVFVLLYCRSMSAYWKLTPDSTSYVLGARSLAEGKGYQEQGKPVMLFAPGTSMVLTPACLLARGSDYLALNGEIILFAFAALTMLFLLYRDTLGIAGSGMVVLLCLGSTEYFDRSTYLLSEIFYLFFSLLAFYWYRRGSTTGTVLSSLAALMVRTVGFCLPVTFVLDTLLFAPHEDRTKKWRNAALYAAPLLFSALWEWRNRHMGWSYTELMMENDPWNRAGGTVRIQQLLHRLWDISAYSRVMEDTLTNQLTKNAHWAVWPAIALILFLALGFFRLARKREFSAVCVYTVLFFLVVVLYWPDVLIRLMFPIIPFLMAYLVAGIHAAARMPKRRWLLILVACCLPFYFARGYQQDLAILAVDRAARISESLVISPGREDIERLALWWKAHAERLQTYACQHPNLINVITGKNGVHYETSGNSGELEQSMRSKHAGFLLLDLNSSADLAVDRLAKGSTQFRLLRDDGKARLYQLVQQ